MLAMFVPISNREVRAAIIATVVTPSFQDTFDDEQVVESRVLGPLSEIPRPRGSRDRIPTR